MRKFLLHRHREGITIMFGTSWCTRVDADVMNSIIECKRDFDDPTAAAAIFLILKKTHGELAAALLLPSAYREFSERLLGATCEIDENELWKGLTIII